MGEQWWLGGDQEDCRYVDVFSLPGGGDKDVTVKQTQHGQGEAGGKICE